jgi:hypothetical protein
MIDFNDSNELITIAELPSRLPKRGGKPLNHTTVWRWVSRGIRGGIRLECVSVGAQLCTTGANLHAFFERLEANRQSRLKGAPPAALRTARQRQAASEAAEAELARRGA